MKSKKILIVEDELIIASDIEMTLQELGYQVTAIVDNAEDALNSIKNNKPDLVLLDINLEGDTDGIMLAEDINNHFQIPFVFLTSNTDPLTINRVKRTHPAGFIVKPFSDKDLQSNIEIALYSKANDKQENKKMNAFFIKDGSSLIKIKPEELMFVQADDNYTRFFTTSDEHLISATLKKASEKLPENIFVRIHRSYIININFIDRIQDGYVFIAKHRMSIGRSYHESFFNRISKL